MHSTAAAKDTSEGWAESIAERVGDGEFGGQLKHCDNFLSNLKAKFFPAFLESPTGNRSYLQQVRFARQLLLFELRGTAAPNEGIKLKCAPADEQAKK